MLILLKQNIYGNERFKFEASGHLFLIFYRMCLSMQFLFLNSFFSINYVFDKRQFPIKIHWCILKIFSRSHTICPILVWNFYIMFNCIVSEIFCRFYFSLWTKKKYENKTEAKYATYQKYFVQLRRLNYCKWRKMHDCTNKIKRWHI